MKQSNEVQKINLEFYAGVINDHLGYLAKMVIEAEDETIESEFIEAAGKLSAVMEELKKKLGVNEDEEYYMRSIQDESGFGEAPD